RTQLHECSPRRARRSTTNCWLPGGRTARSRATISCTPARSPAELVSTPATISSIGKNGRNMLNATAWASMMQPAYTRGTERGRCGMARMVRCALIQATCEWTAEKFSLAQIKQKMIAKHEKMIAAAAKRKVQILGLQELFYGPYFCAEQQARWYEMTEHVPGGPTIASMQKLARRYHMVAIVPVYEGEVPGR